MNVTGGPTSRSRGWTWSGLDTNDDRDVPGSDAESIIRRKGKDVLRTGAKTEEAAKETAALLAKVREQQEHDLAIERVKRMPEVEKMAQRYSLKTRSL